MDDEEEYSSAHRWQYSKNGENLHEKRKEPQPSWLCWDAEEDNVGDDSGDRPAGR